VREFLKDGVGLVFLATIAATVAILSVWLTAQEKPVRPMRQWELGELPRETEPVDWGQQGVPKVRVDVFDTEGVCLYVTRAYLSTRDWQVNTVAVPKTQLPKGTGCQ